MQAPFFTSEVPLEDQCRYPSKFCGNARARKVNGTKHRFCEYHRQRANFNQKRWSNARRQAEPYSKPSRSSTDVTALPEHVVPQPYIPMEQFWLPVPQELDGLLELVTEDTFPFGTLTESLSDAMSLPPPADWASSTTASEYSMGFVTV